MARPSKYWKLLRIKIALVFFFPFGLGFTVAADADPAMAWYKPVIAILAFFCGTLFASTLNFYADVAADRSFEGRFKDMDLRKQPFVTGEMGSAETAAVFAVSGLGCVALSLLVGYRFAAFWIPFPVVVGFLYSHPWVRLKARPVTDIICNILGMGFALFAGLSLGGSIRPSVMFMVWGSVFIAIVYIPTVVNDAPFDQAAGYRTSAVFFGPGRLLYSTVPLLVASIPLAVLLAASSSEPWQFRIAAPLGSALAMAGVAVVIHQWRPPRVELNPNLVLIPMDLLVVFFLAYGFIRIGCV